MHTADGSDKGSCTIKIKGLTHHFEPPLPEVTRSKQAAALVTEAPDYDMLDAQGRKQDREAMKVGETASVIAGARRKRPRPFQSETKDESDENDSDENKVDGVKAYEVEKVLDKRLVGGGM